MNTDRSLVSVVIPCYNAEPFIRATLKSLVLQTHYNIEIIVSDNASEDRTGDIIKSFAMNDARIKYYKNENNLGYTENIRKGVAYARSEYIAIYHADDLYEPSIIETELSIMTQRLDITAVLCRRKTFSRSPKHAVQEHYWDSYRMSPLYDADIRAFVGDIKDFIGIILTVGNPFSCPSLMIRRKTYYNIGGFTNRYPSNEDLDLWLRLLMHGERMAVVDQYLLCYRRSREQGYAKWEALPELPVMFQVIDDLIISDKEVVKTSQQLTSYNALKARGFLLACTNAIALGDQRLARRLRASSLESYSAKATSLLGLFQRHSRLYLQLRRVHRRLNDFGLFACWT